MIIERIFVPLGTICADIFRFSNNIAGTKYSLGHFLFKENWRLYIPSMANTYTQLHIQFVFAVKYRAALIQKGWKEELHKYITGIFQANDHKMLQINSMPDHIHILIGMRPTQSVSALIQNVKAESTKWIKEKKFCSAAFAWQEGYGAFSYSKSHVPTVIRYIQNQDTHHRKITFLEEYEQFLKAFDINYEDRYIFKQPL